ncbi:MAG: hypothetical protein R3F41_12385 [Gammaproteobacteria bacterium]|nr:hypothetical protein [Pseudomonadales bacterium]MCP5348894.1 hypothetical protein [Pseudomonadales bacterium]
MINHLARSEDSISPFRWILGALLCALLWSASAANAQSGVEIQSTPDGGLHPRLLQDADGNVHLLYFRKRSRNPRAREGDLFYRQYDAASFEWGPARLVSSQSFNHADPIYRANFAVDGSGRVHVVWYQSRPSQFFYTRSNPERTEFEPRREMVVDNLEGVDAGADIAALGDSVAISWAAGALTHEDERTVYARISSDGGDTFTPELQIGDTGLGACSCCSLALDYDSAGQFTVAYRSAIEGIGRHMQLLTVAELQDSKPATRYAELHDLQKWELSACPVSTNDIARDYQHDNWLVFETESRIVQLNMSTDAPPTLVAEPATRTRQKNPSIAFSSDGYKLIAWGEAVSFTRGGTLNWQLFDDTGKPVAAEVKPEILIPDNSSPAATITPSGNFLILY